MSERSQQSRLQLSEELSAVIDSEGTSAEVDAVLQELAHDPDTRAMWERQHAVSALLRGDKLQPSTSVNWESLYSEFSDKQPSVPSRPNIVSIEYLRSKFSVTWIAGAALAATVLLVGSLYIATQPQIEIPTGQLADESLPTEIPGIPANPLPEVNPRDALRGDTPPTASFASFEDSNAAPVPEEKSASDQPPLEQLDRRLPDRPANQPNRDLIKLVSD